MVKNLASILMRRNIGLLFCLLFTGILNFQVCYAENIKIQDSIPASSKLRYALAKLENQEYTKCISICNSILEKDKQNDSAHALLSDTYVRLRQWSLSINHAEKTLEINPANISALENLYTGLITVQKYKEAQTACIKALKINPQSDLFKQRLSYVSSILRKQFIFNILIFIVFTIVFLQNIKKWKQSLKNKIKPKIHNSFLILIACSVSLILYYLFFQFAPTFRSFNEIYPPEDYTLIILYNVVDHDGIEGYILYAMALAGILLSLLVFGFLKKISSINLHFILKSIILFLGCYFIASIGFFLPETETGGNILSLITLIIGVSLISGLLLVTNKYFPKTIPGAIAIILIPICFVSTKPLSIPDFSFLLGPAMKLMQGEKLADIYFQYDVFLSLLVSLWMKLKLDLNHFQVLGQLSYYLLFTSLFIISRKIFYNKTLSVYLLISLLLIRYYALASDPVFLFQATPWRLELWVLLIGILYFRSSHSRLLAIAIGMLILLHRNFGLLYLAAYIQLIAFLFFNELIQKNELNRKGFWNGLKSYFKLYKYNILIIGLFIAITSIIFGGLTPRSALRFQKMGIGMIPIAQHSFYWFIILVPIVLAMISFHLQRFISKKYLAISLFIVFLAIGNSMYFYGRSHELNLLNVSTLYILAFFLILDCIEKYWRSISDFSHGREINFSGYKFKLPLGNPLILSLIPIGFILFSAFSYAGRITRKTSLQKQNILQHETTQPLEFQPDINAIRKMTQGSEKVYFLDYNYDVLMAFYGKYKVIGAYSPVCSWAFRRELADYAQNLLNKGYFLVSSNRDLIEEILPLIDFNNISESSGYMAISRNNNPYLLTEKSPVFHKSITALNSTKGIPVAALNIPRNYSLECLVKPSVNDSLAFIIDNADTLLIPRGFSIRSTGEKNNGYLFSMGNSANWLSSDTFSLKENAWNLISISVNSDQQKITLLINGQEISSIQLEKPFIPSEELFILGCSLNHKFPFKGKIKEILIDNKDLKLLTEQWGLVKNKLLEQ